MRKSRYSEEPIVCGAMLKARVWSVGLRPFPRTDNACGIGGTRC